MNLYLGVTDTNWYTFLSANNPEDVNFWQPGGQISFKALERGAPFLFKLKYPENAIGGVGFFVSHSRLPLSLAWDTFGAGNGSATYAEFRSSILSYRNDKNTIEPDPIIGCIILTDPVFFRKEDWFDAPPSWKKNIVSGKTYSTEEPEGRAIWANVEERLQRYRFYEKDIKPGDTLVAETPAANRYGAYLSKVRVGQGSFRLLITDAYGRRCAVSGERTVPALEAAHIKPYAESGPHAIANGLLLRSDIHRLFDRGYLTVAEDYSVEVSKRIKEEYENGRDYYRYHGQKLEVLPARIQEQPGGGYLRWHNEQVYRA
jgi:putative restriction endonuclease